MSKDHRRKPNELPKSHKRIEIVRLISNGYKNIQNFALLITKPLNKIGQVSKRLKSSLTLVALVTTAILAGHTVSAQVSPPPPSQPLGSLKSVAVPEPSNLGEFVKDKTAAIALGKSLFWDMQVGSDGLQSCASCHFHAGTDTRAKNQLHPGPDTTVEAGLNYTLKPSDFPFHKLSNPSDRKSAVISDILMMLRVPKVLI